MNEQLDQDVVNLAKAIRKVESGDNENARGASGEFGLYQFMPDTWASTTAKYGLDPNDRSRQNQNKAAYMQVKELKDAGHKPSDIAGFWNSGKVKGWENNVGVNDSGVQFDTPGYVQKVGAAYQEVKGGGGTQTTAYLPQTDAKQAAIASGEQPTPVEPQEETLGQKLSGRLGQASEALSKSGSGKQGVVSGVLQTVGAGAGAIGDVTTGFVELVPGVKTVEKVVGKVVSKGAQTKLGQDLIQSYSNFANEHPEAAANIGAVGNILSVIPMFKGFQLASQTVKTGLAKTFEKSLEKSVAEELRQSTVRTIKGSSILKNAEMRGIDPIENLVKNKILPETIQDANGIPRYSTSQAYETIGNRIAQNEDKLQGLLQEASTKGIVGYVPIDSLEKDTIEVVKKELKGSPDYLGAIEKVKSDFNSVRAAYGTDAIPLSETTDVKRMFRKSVNFNSPLMDQNVRYHIGQSLMKTVEDVADRLGVHGVREVNKEMARDIVTQNFLKYLDNRSIVENPGLRALVGRRSGDVGTIAGEAIGQSFGVPGAGAVIGRAVTNKAVGGSKGRALELLGGKKKKVKGGVPGLVSPVLYGGVERAETK